MQTIIIEPSFESWRDAARGLLRRGIAPDQLLWNEDGGERPLFGAHAGDSPMGPTPVVPAAFLDMARSAAAHRDPQRWAMLYQILWRITRGNEKAILGNPTDPDVRMARQWCKAVGRDIHKMHAFVRFRRVAVDGETGRERFVAWFEPEHRIVKLAAPFFRKRFAGMDWSILTPDECAHWDGSSLTFTPGVFRETAPEDDELDELWRVYYRNIFNPARLKVKAMQSEMPKKYWKNLPESPLIDELISGSRKRVQEMLETEERPVKPTPNNAYLNELKRMNEG